MRTLPLFLMMAAACLPAHAQSPCSLVSTADVQAAIGSPVSEATPNKTNKSVCDYKIGAGSILNILLAPKGPGDSGERTASELNKRKIKAEVVTGIGESAYASSPGYGMQQIGVYKGSHHVVVTAMIMGAPEAKVKAAVRAVAQKAIGKL